MYILRIPLLIVGILVLGIILIVIAIAQVIDGLRSPRSEGSVHRTRSPSPIT